MNNATIKKIAKELCEKSPCHHKCHDVTDCVVEDEALLLINENKSNNFDVKSNNEKEKIISDICPLYKEYGTCEQCNLDLDIDDEPCYFECMANAIINNDYRKQSEGEWKRQKGRHEAICSECGREVVYQVIDNKWAFENFCPHCGAKMKGGAE